MILGAIALEEMAMNEEKEMLIKEIMQKVEKIPDEAKNAFEWIADHWDLVKDMCKLSKMPVEKIDQLIEDAWKMQDYIMLYLLVITKDIRMKTI